MELTIEIKQTIQMIIRIAFKMITKITIKITIKITSPVKQTTKVYLTPHFRTDTQLQGRERIRRVMFTFSISTFWRRIARIFRGVDRLQLIFCLLQTVSDEKVEIFLKRFKKCEKFGKVGKVKKINIINH